MAKTIVINGSDYHVNSFTHVQFGDLPDCVPDWEWATGGPDSVPTTYPMTYKVSTTYKYIMAFGLRSQQSTYQVGALDANTVPYPYAIKIPTAAKRIRISATDTTQFYNGTGGRIIWGQDIESPQRGMIACVDRTDINCSQIPVTVDVPDGANAFTVTLRFANAQSAESANALVASLGIKIEFLPASE